jgi:nucleotide-binding universal stress UspA family protein
MTTHGRGRLRWAVAGSVAEAVIRDATRPLLLVGPHGVATWSDPPGQVVACVDGTQAGVAVARAAGAWAKALGSEVTLVFVAHPLDVEDATHPEHVFDPPEDALEDAGAVVHTRFVRSSFVPASLVDVAEEPPATMLVMGARAGSRVARAVLGSVTMGVVNLASCPVLVIPPHLDDASGE